jgi:serine/threonine protein kinase
MEFINGKELTKAIEDYKKQNNGAIEDGLLIYVGREIADALEIIHQQGYIYRDLKPQNVMLDGISSRVKLIDFGTLYHVSDKEPLLFESEGYTPPEFIKKDTRFTPAGDVYSLGALLYEIAIGETPKLGEAHFIDKTGIDPRIAEIIKKCLDPDPLKRFQKARQVRDELNKLTKKGFWPFRNSKAIEPVELSVLPKTLYPPSCTFCDYCGLADPQSHLGYCSKCRIPLRVGRVQLVDEKAPKEFFLYSDETIIGSSPQSHFSLGDKSKVHGLHVRIFRRKTALWMEAVAKDSEDTLLNRRKILGPVELVDGDTIELPGVSLKFSIKDAC